MEDHKLSATEHLPVVVPNSLDAWYIRLTIRLIQYGCWLILQLPLAVIIRRNRLILQSNELTSPSYILAANHQSVIDPFIILAILPWSIFTRLSPYRFFAHNGLLRSLGKRWFLLAGGCFPSRPHPRYIAGLEAAQHFLANGQTIFIFPEGRRSVYEAAKPRRGVAELAASPNVQVIPIKIIWHRRGRWIRTCDIIVGAPFAAQHSTAETIMERIYALQPTTRG